MEFKNMLKMLPENLNKNLLVSTVAVIVATTAPMVNTYAQTGIAEVAFAGYDICVPDTITIPQKLKQAPPGDQSELPTNIEADEFETEADGVIRLSGNAQVIQGNQGVYADEISYNQESYQATAVGNVEFFSSRGDKIQADSLDMEVDTFIGDATGTQVEFAEDSLQLPERKHERFVEDYSIFAPFLNKVPPLTKAERIARESNKEVDENTYVRTRATAENIEFEGADYQLLKNATMTACVEGDDDILLTAKQIEMDHVAGIGTAKSMTVRFKNVPIFYFPTATFPINDERKTGFLFPGFGYEDESGAILEIPYYINIAPNHDATIIPRILTERGVQVYGEYRYLTQTSEGSLKAEALPSDDVYLDDRYAVKFEHVQDFNEEWFADADISSVSDTEYVRDFSSDVGVVSSSYLPQNANLNYRGEYLTFLAKATAYEAINSSVTLASQPYEILPQLDLNLRPQDLGLFEYGIDSQFIDFQHDDNTRVAGSRLRVDPYISLPFEPIYGYVKPKLSLRTISYSLDNAATGDDSPSTSVPIGSIDSGLFFERVFDRGERNFMQTLEPRLFYLNIPTEEEQNLFPDFDTGGGSNSSFSHYFRENRFFGGDRVGDTNQLSLGLTSRIIDNDDGRQRLNFSLGQIYYFEDRLVSLTPELGPETETKSDFLAEITASANEDWNVRAFTRIGGETDDLESIQVSADYFHSDRRNGSLNYSRNKDADEQINLALETPLGPSWQFKANGNYSLEESKYRSSEIGFAYDGCCWATSLVAQRYLDGTGVYRNRYVVVFELDDLGRLRSRI
jgi:LPS-assembly protein